MVKIRQAVFDAGPFIHLHEINQYNLLNLFETIRTTPAVLDECGLITTIIRNLQNIQVKGLQQPNKDFAKILIEQYVLGLGESSALALCRQESVRLFFTDDLEARHVAITLGFEPHGTLAVILRAFRHGITNKKETISIIERLSSESSLFFTSDLKTYVLREIEKFEKA